MHNAPKQKLALCWRNQGQLTAKKHRWQAAHNTDTIIYKISYSTSIQNKKSSIYFVVVLLIAKQNP